MMGAPVILIPDRVPAPADVEQAVFGPRARIILGDATESSQIPDDVWAAADAVLAWHDIRLTAEIIGKLERCQVIVRVGVGTDNVDLQAAGEHGIVVCNVPDYGTADVADHAIALLLALSRGLGAFNERLRESNRHWRWDGAGPLHRLAGATLGIIGLGRIGTATALRARPFGMRVVFYDPYVPDGQDKALGVTRCDELFDLLAEADAVSVHAPLTPETAGMANASFFDALKSGGIFINTARGAIVDLDALMNALRSGGLRGAGLDVLPTEPPDPDHPLIRAWRSREPWVAHRLILTPHAAFYCREAFEEMRRKAAVEAKRVLDGRGPRNCVNAAYLMTPRQPAPSGA